MALKINLSSRQQDALKAALATDDLQPILDKVLQDWMANIVTIAHEKKKSVDEKIDDILTT